MKYKIKFAQLWTPRYGFCLDGTAGVDAETVTLSGMRVQGCLLWLLLLPCAFGANNIVGIYFGVQLKQMPIIVIYSALLFIIYYRWKSVFYASVSLKKRFITNLARDRKKVSFFVSDPEGMAGPPVKVALEAKNEEEAVKLETELSA